MSSDNLFSVGLDIGNKQDFSVIAFAHYQKDCCWLREIHQLPLGTGYPKLINGVCALIKVLQTKGQVVSFVFDGTGGGDVFGNFLAEAFDKAGIDCPREPYIFTPSSKWQLITNMKMLVHSGRLRFEGGESYEKQRQIKNLKEEMQAYQFRRIANNDGTFHDELGVFSAGKHDDMVTATALAAWHYNEYFENNQEVKIGVIEDQSWIKSPLDGGNEESYGVAVSPRF